MKHPIFDPEMNGHPPQMVEVEIHTPQGVIRGLLRKAEGARGATLMVGGAEGGLDGPSGIYEPLAERLQKAGITALRLDYRLPNDLAECVYDVLAGIEAVRQQGVERVALLGWSFGGAVAINAGVASDMVVGVAAVACQTFGAEAVVDLSPKSLLLMHGTGDQMAPDICSRELYARASEPKELALYPGDDHGLTLHASEALDKLYAWSRKLLLISAGASGR